MQHGSELRQRVFVEVAPEAETANLRSRVANLEAQVAEMRRLREREEPTTTTNPIEDATMETTAPELSADAPAEHSGRGRRIAAFSLLGLGGAGIAVFAGSLVGIDNAGDGISPYCGASVGLPADRCLDNAEVGSADSRIGTFRGLGWTSVGVGAAALAVGTTLLLLGGDDEDETATTASVTCDRAGCMGVVNGRF